MSHHSPEESNPQEMMRQQIMEAPYQDVMHAIKNDISHLEARMEGANDLQTRLLLDKVRDADHAKRTLRDWSAFNRDYVPQGEPNVNFPDYVKGIVEAGDESEQAYYAQRWTESSYYKSVGDVIRARQERESSFESEPGPSPTKPQLELPKVDPKVEAAAKVQAIIEARTSVERARNAELFNDIVRVGKNKTQLHADFTRGFTDLGDGLKTDRENKKIAYMPQQIRQEVNKDPNWRNHLNEAVSFSAVNEVKTQQVTRKHEQKGKFGRTHSTEYTVTETIPGSEHPKIMRNELTGKDEPTVRFRYMFKYSDQALMEKELPRYKEFKGSRDGAQILAGVDLPESIARNLERAIMQDPASARDIVERLFLENNDGSITEQHWSEGGENKHPMRPPYEQLPKDWTIAVLKGSELNDVSNVHYGAIDRLPAQSKPRR